MKAETEVTIAKVRELLSQANRLLDDVVGDSHPLDLKQAEDIEALQESVYDAMRHAENILEPRRLRFSRQRR